jgi:hypothetical protein
MVPQPIALGLTLCQQVVVEEGTKNVSLINAFTVWNIAGLSSAPRPFCAVATLIDGEGDGTIELAITREETEALVFTIQRPIHFPDRLTEVRALCRINGCSFPAVGLYSATLLVDGEWVTQRRFRVSVTGGAK